MKRFVIYYDYYDPEFGTIGLKEQADTHEEAEAIYEGLKAHESYSNVQLIDQNGRKGKGVMLMTLPVLYCPHCDEFHNEDELTIWIEMDYVTCKSTKKEIKTWKMDTENTVKWRNHMKFL